MSTRVLASARLAAGRATLGAQGWFAAHNAAYDHFKLFSDHQATLVYVDTENYFCVYIVPSDCFWLGFVTQVSIADISLLCFGQHNEPLEFLPRHFTGSRLQWITI